MLDGDRIDTLIEQSRPGAIVLAAAALLAIEGLLLFLVGLQTAVFLGLGGLLGGFALAMMAVGAGSILAAYGFGRGHGAAVPGALVAAAVGLLAASAFVVTSLLHGVLSPMAFSTIGGGLLALVVVAVAHGSAARTARARRQLGEVDLGDGEQLDAVQQQLQSSGRSFGFVFGLVTVLGLAAAVILVLAMRSVPGKPNRLVVVQVGSVEPSSDQRFVEAVSARLADRGFDVVVAPSPLPEGDLVAAARRAASEADAGHAVVLELSGAAEREGVVPGTSLWAVALTLHLVPEDEAGEARSESLELAFDGATAAEVSHLVHGTLVDALLPSALEAVYESPAFGPVLRGEVSLEDVASASRLRDLEPAVERRRKAARSYAEFCARESDRIRAFATADERPVQCVGDPCGQLTVIGLDAADRAVVQDISRQPIFPVPPAARSSWAEPPERILAVPLAAGGGELPLFRAGHFYGFGAVSQGGRFATVQPFGVGGVQAVHTLELATGARLHTALLRPRERSAFALPSPDGLTVLARLRGGEWVALSGASRVTLPAFTTAGWVELEGGPAIAGQLQGGELVLVAPDGAVAETGLVLPGRLVAVLAPRAGRLQLVVETEDGCALLRVEPGRPSEAERLGLPLCLDSPRALPDGRLVGTAETAAPGDVPGDAEVVLLDPETGEALPLTSGPFTEEVAFPTRDGSRVVFSRRLEGWPAEHDLRIYRRVLCWVDLPARAP